MKNRVIYILYIAMVVFMLTACSASELAEIYDEDEVINQAKEIVTSLNAFDYKQVNAQVREDVQEHLSAEVLETACNAILTDAGQFKDYKEINTAGQKSKSTGEDYANVILICNYENRTITYTINMDENLEIVGLYLK